MDLTAMVICSSVTSIFELWASVWGLVMSLMSLRVQRGLRVASVKVAQLWLRMWFCSAAVQRFEAASASNMLWSQCREASLGIAPPPPLRHRWRRGFMGATTGGFASPAWRHGSCEPFTASDSSPAKPETRTSRVLICPLWSLPPAFSSMTSSVRAVIGIDEVLLWSLIGFSDLAAVQPEASLIIPSSNTI